MSPLRSVCATLRLSKARAKSCLTFFYPCPIRAQRSYERIVSRTGCFWDGDGPSSYSYSPGRLWAFVRGTEDPVVAGPFFDGGLGWTIADARALPVHPVTLTQIPLIRTPSPGCLQGGLPFFLAAFFSGSGHADPARIERGLVPQHRKGDSQEFASRRHDGALAPLGLTTNQVGS